MTAVTALTAQNTVGVTGIHGVPGDFIVEQVRAVADDIGVDAVKIGMLGTADTVRAVREALGLLDPGTPIVLDPVMVSESGAVLLDEAARAAIVAELLPVVTVITPNVPEARVLAGSDEDDVEQLARRLHELGPRVVVVTGGHREQATDTFFDGDALETLAGERYPDGAAHGSGCTHSSALAAHLALGYSPLQAAKAARQIAGEAVRDGIRGLGAGAGPVDVFALSERPRAPLGGARAGTGPLP
jgi:hydroxymethylpyrimidine/phosphomethylpyrimidine kinase